MASDALEALFVRAFAEPALRPAFLRLLMRSELLALTALQRGERDRSIVAYRRHDGALAVPAFTSDQAHSVSESLSLPGIGAPVTIWIATRVLMASTRGMHIHINPGGTFSRNFSPDEIAWLLSQEPLQFGTPDPLVLAKSMDIQLKKLDVSLPLVEAALARAFLAAPEVTRAFLVEVERIRRGCLERTLMMVAQAPPSASLTSVVSAIFDEVYDHVLLVDLCFDEGDKELVQTLAEVGAKPFYERPQQGGPLPLRVH